MDLSTYHEVKYSKKIKPNQVRLKDHNLEIEVQKSSSALVYKFSEIKKIKGILVKAKLDGKINYGDKIVGKKGADDFPLRIGIIEKGDTTLNFFQQVIAADWIIQLNDLGKGFGGVSKIYNLVFYTEAPEYEKRFHPLSDYFFEVRAASFKEGSLNERFLLEEEIEALGLWISADGDDTMSDFTLTIEKLELL